MDPQRGTERGVRRGSAGADQAHPPQGTAQATPREGWAALLRQALEQVAEGQCSVSLDELRRHLSRAEQNLCRLHLRGGRYLALQMSPHITALCEMLAAEAPGPAPPEVPPGVPNLEAFRSAAEAGRKAQRAKRKAG